MSCSLGLVGDSQYFSNNQTHFFFSSTLFEVLLKAPVGATFFQNKAQVQSRDVSSLILKKNTVSQKDFEHHLAGQQCWAIVVEMTSNFQRIFPNVKICSHQVAHIEH